MITFHCPACGRLLKIADAHAGRKGQCPRCASAVTVPLPASSGSNLSGSRSGLVAPAKAKTAPPKKRRPLHPLVPPGSRKLEFEEVIDMTAMVDIVFFLLIFFMITSFNAKQASIEMPAPAPSTGATGKASAHRTVEDFDNDADFVVVRIDADDTMWVEDSAVLTPPDLAVKLRQAMRGEGRHGDNVSKMMVVAHSEATHGALVAAMDTGHSVGINDVRLAVKDEE